MIGKLQDSSRQSTERVAVKDVRLVYRACSKGFARALGLESPDLVIGRTDFDLLPREIARQQLVIESEVVNRAQTDITSLTLATAQHTQTVMRTPILSADQEVRGLDVRLLDAPGQGAPAPLDYHALVHAGLQGTIVIRDGKPLFVNRQALHLFGLSEAADLLNRPTIAGLFAAEDWSRLKRHCDAMENQHSTATRSRLILNASSRTGQQLVLLVNAEHISWQEHPAVILSLVDMAGNESSVSASGLIPSTTVSDERYQHYARASADFFWETDESLDFTLVNSEMENALGIPIDDLLGQPYEALADATGGIEGEEHWEPHFQTINNHQPFRDFEFKWQILDGSVKVIRYSGIPVYDGNAMFLGYRGTGRDVTVSTRQAESMAYHANHDALTGLVNRRHFEHLVGDAIKSAPTERKPHALLFLDLDNFKIVNDTCGHLAGDELLRQLSALIKSLVRKSDVFARLGGDEFGVFLYKCNVAEALKLANQIRSEVENFQFLWKENRFHVGVSIGMVVADDRWESLTALFSAADSACYIAKNEGRNQVVVYREADGNSSNRKVETHWVEEINTALDENRVAIATQKLLPLRQLEKGWQPPAAFESDSGNHGDNNTASNADTNAYFEVFMRLVMPSGELVGPQAFLPSAERYGLAAQLDSTVIDVTLDWLKKNPANLNKIRHCSINLSSGSFASEGFAEALIAHIRDSGVPAQKLCFELTETATIANLSAASSFMHKLADIGCRFVLDDFGAGLSSFAYLKDLPVDYLKIDGRLVRDMLDDQINYTMVKAINEVGQSLGKQTIAEFVESEILFEAIREIGVDFAQGYAIGKPQIQHRKL